MKSDNQGYFNVMLKTKCKLICFHINVILC